MILFDERVFNNRRMKTIKIFLASSDELKLDRVAFGNLVRRLDDIYEKRGMRIKLVEWEDTDAAYNGLRKQDEYNEEIRSSDMFLALFKIKAGRYTIEEFNVASDEFKKKARPKVYAYCRTLHNTEKESPELTEFKRTLLEELGHYWCNYYNEDSLQLHFILQLQLIENNILSNLDLKEGRISVNGVPIADMDNLKFAKGNREYIALRKEIDDLLLIIGNEREEHRKKPEDQELSKSLQIHIDKYNILRAEFDQIQRALLDTAKRVSEIQAKQISRELQLAISAFEEGNTHYANNILDSIVIQAPSHLEQLNLDRKLIHQDIEAARLQAKIAMADLSINADIRVEKVVSIYSNAIEWAKKSSYDRADYTLMLNEYVVFLTNAGRYDIAVNVAKDALSLSSEGEESSIDSYTYNNIGYCYYRLGLFDEAIQSYNKAIGFFNGEVEKGGVFLAAIYNNLGIIFQDKREYERALNYYFKALSIQTKEYGEYHADVAASYHGIGSTFGALEDYDKEYEYESLAESIQNKILPAVHQDRAAVYEHLAIVYARRGDVEKTTEYFHKSLSIREKIFGENHFETVHSFYSLGALYETLKDFPKAEEYYTKALKIRVVSGGKSNSGYAAVLLHIGLFYYSHNKLQQCLPILEEAASLMTTDQSEVVRRELSECHGILGAIYQSLKKYAKAFEHDLKALALMRELYGDNSPKLAVILNNTGSAACFTGHYDEAIDFIEGSLQIQWNNNTTSHPLTASCYANLALAQEESGRYRDALESYQKAYSMFVEARDYALQGHLYNKIQQMKLASAQKGSILSRIFRRKK